MESIKEIISNNSVSTSSRSYEEQEIPQRTKVAILNRRILSPRWRKWTFEVDDGSAPNITAFLQKWVDNFPDNRKINAGIRFHGNVGTGKTFFAACLANEIYKRYYNTASASKIPTPPMMATIPQLIEAKDDKSSDEDSWWYWGYANRCPVLILDDVGVEAKTSYRQECVFNLINNRLMLENAVTIITTNISSKDMEESRDDLESSRLYSRLIELCPIPITMNGKDHRVEVAAEIKRQIREGIA